MSEQEKTIGLAVRAHREASTMSQQDLATAMRGVGYKWAQATVWSVENGDRPLRYSEAQALAGICGFTMQAPNTDDVTRGIDLAIQALHELKEKL